MIVKTVYNRKILTNEFKLVVQMKPAQISKRNSTYLRIKYQFSNEC